MGKSLWQKVNESDQKSMAPYVWGTKIAKMCSELQKIKGPASVKGAGRIVYAEGQELRGEVREITKYYEADR